jgi:hypothetical protein
MAVFAQISSDPFKDRFDTQQQSMLFNSNQQLSSYGPINGPRKRGTFFGVAYFPQKWDVLPPY